MGVLFEVLPSIFPVQHSTSNFLNKLKTKALLDMRFSEDNFQACSPFRGNFVWMSETRGTP